jgi:oligopeptide transport system substrate-binding protein
MARQIYVNLRITSQDYAILLRDLRRGQYQLGYTSWLADYNDASNFLDLLRSSSPGNYAGYRNPRFDAALDAAEREPDAHKRATMLKQAESLAQKDMPWLPIRFASQTELVAPKVSFYVPNAADYNRSRWLSIKK